MPCPFRNECYRARIVNLIDFLSYTANDGGLYENRNTGSGRNHGPLYRQTSEGVTIQEAHDLTTARNAKVEHGDV